MSRVAKDLRLASVESERAWPSTPEYAQNRELEWCRPTQDASMRPAMVERNWGFRFFRRRPSAMIATVPILGGLHHHYARFGSLVGGGDRIFCRNSLDLP